MIPDVSVVMANYNGVRFIDDAIRSLQAQTLRNWELIVTDDVSTDGSGDVARAFAVTDSRITVVKQERNSGPGGARNRGLSIARGRWIAIFDNDDLMRPERLQTLLRRATDDHALVVADRLHVFSENGHHSDAQLPTPGSAGAQWIGLAEFVDSNRLHSRGPDLGYVKPMIHAGLLRSSGITYDESLRIGEDYDFLAKLIAFGPRLRLDPGAHYLYRRHSGSVSHRLHASDIVALLDADGRLRKSLRPLSAAETAAFDRRRRSLNTMLEFDHVIQLIKRRQYGSAVWRSLRKPTVWTLLTRPVSARARRVFAVRRSSTLGAASRPSQQREQ